MQYGTVYETNIKWILSDICFPFLNSNNLKQTETEIQKLSSALSLCVPLSCSQAFSLSLSLSFFFLFVLSPTSSHHLSSPAEVRTTNFTLFKSVFCIHAIWKVTFVIILVSMKSRDRKWNCHREWEQIPTTTLQKNYTASNILEFKDCRDFFCNFTTLLWLGWKMQKMPSFIVRVGNISFRKGFFPTYLLHRLLSFTLSHPPFTSAHVSFSF